MTKYFILLVFVLISVIACPAQQLKLECPLINGKVKKLNTNMFSHSDPANGAIIESADSLVIAGVSGKVIKTGSVANYYYVLVRTDSTTILGYSRLARIYVKENDLVTTMSKVGVGSKLENGLYELRLSLRNRTQPVNPRTYLSCVD